MVAEAAAVLGGDSRDVVSALHARMSLLAGQERFEDAGAVRDRMLHLVRAAARAQRLAPLAASPEVVAARRTRRRRLGGRLRPLRPARGDDDHSPRRRPDAVHRALTASAEVVAPGSGPVPAATPEETEKVLRWLEAPGVRIVSLEGEWTCPVHGAGAARARLEPLAAAPRDAVGFDEPASAATGRAHRPARRPATAFGSRGR